MKDGVRIVNCARGGCMDPEAIAEGVKSGKIAGAAIDVYPTEPLTKENNPSWACSTLYKLRTLVLPLLKRKSV